MRFRAGGLGNSPKRPPLRAVAMNGGGRNVQCHGRLRESSASLRFASPCVVSGEVGRRGNTRRDARCKTKAWPSRQNRHFQCRGTVLCLCVLPLVPASGALSMHAANGAVSQ